MGLKEWLTLNFTSFAEADFEVDFVTVQVASSEGYLSSGDGEGEGSVVALDVFLNVLFQSIFAPCGHVVRTVGVAVDFHTVTQLQPDFCKPENLRAGPLLPGNCPS